MRYIFYCPKCECRQSIYMLVSEYTENNHMCPICNTEMKPDTASYMCVSINKTNTLYRRIN
jgi:hypothetical protein